MTAPACPVKGVCLAPSQCAAAHGCILQTPAPGRVYLLAQAPYPYPLRFDPKPRAVFPQGVPT